MLSKYLNDTNTERLYEAGAKLIESSDCDYEVAGAWLAGDDSAQCTGNYSKHPQRVLDVVEDILNAEADPNGDLRLVGEVGAKAPAALKLLGGFRDGIVVELT